MFVCSLVSILLFNALAAGQSYGFVYPNAPDLVFLLGQNIDIKWNTPFKAIKLAFIAQDGPLFQFFSQNNEANGFTWAVNVNNSGSSSPYYYLYLENQVDNSQHYYSSLFRVDNTVDANRTTAAATITTTPSPSLQASPTTVAGGSTVIITKAIMVSPTTASTAAASVTNSADTSGSTGLSPGAKLGIGVGVPLGILFILGLAFVAVWLSRRHSRDAKRNAGLPGLSNPGNSGYATDNIAMASYAVPEDSSNQGAKLVKPTGYVAVRQHPPMSELPTVQDRRAGVHELPPGSYQPQELDADNAGVDPKNRGYR